MSYYSEFNKWMSIQRKSNGKKYSPNSINAYCNALRNATKNLNIDKSNLKLDLFEYYDHKEFSEAVKYIYSSPNFDEVNRRAGSGSYSAGIKLYALFLQQISTVEGINPIEKKAEEVFPSNIRHNQCNSNKDSYKEFLQHFNISKDEFYDFGLSNIIFAPFSFAKESFEDAKHMLLTNQKLSIRSYGRQGKSSNLFLNLYKYLFNNNNIKVDASNNAGAKRAIQNATGNKINYNIFNYQVSHIWGRTKNPILFESVWNICLVPRLYDPLTGHECTNGWNEEFSKMLRKKTYEQFSSIIDEYNDFVLSMDIIPKIRKFSNMLDCTERNKFLSDAIAEWGTVSCD